MIDVEKIREIKKKKNKLECLRKHLKSRFIGIDNVIEDIIKYLGPWYVFPDVYQTPLIINLWGTTGVGKTALVKEISNFLSKPLIELDVGEFSSSVEFNDVMYGSFIEYSGQDLIILMDEMQQARTVRESSEKERNYLRGIWRLLSDGSVQINRFMDTSKTDILRTLKKYRVPKTEEQHIKAIKKINTEYWWDDDDEGESAIGDTVYGGKIRYLNLKDHRNGVFPYRTMEHVMIFTKMTSEEINNMVRSNPQRGLKEVIKIVEESQISKEINFNKTIIFIAGNLDDLFEMSDDASPDLNIDYLIKQRQKISLPETKQMLLKYFKPEQIARFGNNHLIYPSFSERDYNEIIEMNINGLLRRFEEAIGIKFEYDKSLVDLIYSEGVFPTQGVRPINSTIKGIIETNCQKFIFDLFNKINSSSSSVIKISFDGKKLNFRQNKNCLGYDVDLKIGNLKKVIVDDKHALTSVHEAGHALCHILFTGQIPSKLTSFSANANAEGFVRITLDPDEFIDKELYLGYITVMYGGRAAEMEFFGDKHLSSGAVSDLNRASTMIVSYVEKHGFVESQTPIVTASASSDESIHLPTRRENREIKFENIAFKCLEAARQAVRKNKKFVADVANQLLHKESLNAKDIEKTMKKYNVDQYVDHPYLEVFENFIKQNKIV